MSHSSAVMTSLTIFGLVNRSIALYMAVHLCYLFFLLLVWCNAIADNFLCVVLIFVAFTIAFVLIVVVSVVTVG